MRKILLAVAIFASATAANAQASFGVKGGLNLANLKSKFDGETESGDMKVGFNLGAFATVPLSATFNFKPELVVSTEGSKEEFMGEDVKSNLTFINVPVLLQYNASGFVAETGPQVGFLMSAKAKYDGESEDIKEGFETINLSWAVGLGYQMPSGFGVNARYNLGLSNLAKDSDDYKLKSNVIQIGISYTFGGGSARK